MIFKLIAFYCDIHYLQMFNLQYHNLHREEYLNDFDILMKFAYYATFHFYPVTIKSGFSIPGKENIETKKLKTLTLHKIDSSQ